jgi:DNA-directed RNA polymerase subunit RPC12/RpoP
MFAQLYECSKCGKVWEIEEVEIIDCKNDEVYQVPICNRCNRPCKMLLGQLHALSEDEMGREFICGDNHEYDPEYY